MDSYHVVDDDVVKTEKANAVARYRRWRNFMRLVKFVEVFAVLALVSWSSTRVPAALKAAGTCMCRVSVYLLNPHVAFVFGNLIVLFLCVFSRFTEAGCNVENEKDFEAVKTGEIVESGGDDVSENGENGENAVVVLGETTVDVVSNGVGREEVRNNEDKQIVCFDCYEGSVAKTECEEVVVKAIEESTRRIERFQRTHSEKLKRQISRDLRRSDTNVERMTNSVDHKRRSSTSVLTRTEETSEFELGVNSSYRRCDPNARYVDTDGLSNEEFRLKVEAFILKQQRFIKGASMSI